MSPDSLAAAKTVPSGVAASATMGVGCQSMRVVRCRATSPGRSFMCGVCRPPKTSLKNRQKLQTTGRCSQYSRALLKDPEAAKLDSPSHLLPESKAGSETFIRPSLSGLL